MSNLPRFALLTTNSSFFPSLLKGELERPGLYNWIRAFQTSDIELADMLKLWKQFEKNPEKLNKFDIIHVNLAGGDYGLASLIAPSLDDSTKLVVNTDYAVMNLEPTFKQAPIEMMATDIASADMAFGVEPFNVKLMNWLMKVTKQEKKAYLLPHPVDCDRLTKPPEQGGSFLDFDERLDWLAFHWHRYDQALSVPRTVMGNLPMTEYGGGVSRVLFGWRPDALRIKDAKNLMEVVIPMQAYVNYLIVLSHCFPKGTIVSGLKSKPIEKINPGDYVFSDDGSLNRVDFVFRRGSNQSLLNIETVGRPNILTTLEHPFLVYRPRKTNSGKPLKPSWKYVRERYRDLPSPAWIEAQNIKTGDYLATPIIQEGKGLDYSDDFLWFIGNYIADGGTSGRYSCAITTNNDSDTNKVIDGIQALGLKPSVKGNDTYTRIRFDSIEWNHYLRTVLGSSSATKQLPYWFWELNRKQQLVLLDGYFKGDGSYAPIRTRQNEDAVYAHTISPTLAYDLFLALASMRGHPLLSLQPPSPTGFENGSDIYKIECRDSGVFPQLKKRKLEVHHGFYLDDRYFSRIKKLTSHSKRGRETVYNLQVSNKNTYIANGSIVHNCLWGFEYRFHRAASRFHMECATLGIPVVSSKNSFMGTMLWPELTFEMGEFEQMNAALCEIISDDGLRRKYARQGMERVKQFSLINSRNRYLELLYGDDKD